VLQVDSLKVHLIDILCSGQPAHGMGKTPGPERGEGLFASLLLAEGEEEGASLGHHAHVALSS
jgi:hypothetical protein